MPIYKTLSKKILQDLLNWEFTNKLHINLRLYGIKAHLQDLHHDIPLHISKQSNVWMMKQNKYFGTRKTINERVKHVNCTSRKLICLLKAKLLYDKRKQARVQQGHWLQSNTKLGGTGYNCQNLTVQLKWIHFKNVKL